MKDLVNFPWEEFEKELKELAPTLWAALKAAATSLDTKYRRKGMPSSVVSTCVVAAAGLLKERNIHMTAVQCLLTLLLWHGNASTMVSHFSSFLFDSLYIHYIPLLFTCFLHNRQLSVSTI